ncbi:hypothetical protein B296_00048771, partial [Ensete ventricosum]
HEQLKRNGKKDLDVEHLGLNSGAKTQRGIQVGEVLDHRAALVLRVLADDRMHQPTEQVDACVQLECVDGARRSRWRLGRRGHRRHPAQRRRRGLLGQWLGWSNKGKLGNERRRRSVQIGGGQLATWYICHSSCLGV